MLLYQIDRLQGLYDLVSKEVARVKIELEVPDKNGQYQTNLDAFIEEIPRARFDGVAEYYKFLKDENPETDVTEEDVQKDFKKFIKSLKKLPRVSRQFYAFLLQRSEIHGTKFTISVEKLKRICSYPGMEGELQLLMEQSFCWLNEAEDWDKSPTWGVGTVLNANSDEHTWEFMNFVKKNKLNLDKIVVILDFSDFK